MIRPADIALTDRQTARFWLTVEKVVAIRARHASGATQLGLAKEYGVSNVTIRCIVTRRTWSHV